MNIFQKIPASIYSPKFYKSLIGSSVGSALRYFFFLVLLITFASVLTALPALTKLIPQIKEFENNIVQTFPAELVVNIKDGEVITNVKEPYFIKVDNENAIVIDTKTPYSSAQFGDYGAYIWVGKDTVFYKDGEYSMKTFSLNEIEDVVIDRKLVNSLKTKIDPFIPFVFPVMAVIAAVFMFIFYSLRIIYNFILAVLIWFILKITKKDISYSDSYKVGLHAMTLAFIVDVVLMLLGFGGFTFMFTLISLGVVIVNFIASNLVVDRHK